MDQLNKSKMWIYQYRKEKWTFLRLFIWITLWCSHAETRGSGAQHPKNNSTHKKGLTKLLNMILKRVQATSPVLKTRV